MDADNFRTSLWDFITFSPDFDVADTPIGKSVSLKQLPQTSIPDISLGIVTNSTIQEVFYGHSIFGAIDDNLSTAAAAIAQLPTTQANVDAESIALVTSDYQNNRWGNPWPNDFLNPPDAYPFITYGVFYGMGVPQVCWSYSFKISGLSILSNSLSGLGPYTYGAVCMEQAVKLRVLLYALKGVPRKVRINYVSEIYEQTMQGGLYNGGGSGVPYCTLLTRTLVSSTPAYMDVDVPFLGYNSCEMPLQDITTAPWPAVTMPTLPQPSLNPYYLVNNNMLEYALNITSIVQL